jgi:hypothetical protein
MGCFGVVHRPPRAPTIRSPWDDTLRPSLDSWVFRKSLLTDFNSPRAGQTVRLTGLATDSMMGLAIVIVLTAPWFCRQPT